MANVFSWCRVLLATIRNLGKCPCPRCLILKEQIPKMGTVWDMQQRGAKTDRVSNIHLWQTVDGACKAIYPYGKGVKSASMGGWLVDKSYVPTAVSILTYFIILRNLNLIYNQERVLRSSFWVWDQHFHIFYRWPYAWSGTRFMESNIYPPAPGTGAVVLVSSMML